MAVTDKVYIDIRAEDNASGVIRDVAGEITHLDLTTQEGRIAFDELTGGIYDALRAEDKLVVESRKVKEEMKGLASGVADVAGVIRDAAGRITHLDLKLQEGRIAFDELTGGIYDALRAEDKLVVESRKVKEEMKGLASGVDGAGKNLLVMGTAVLAAVGGVMALKRALIATLRTLKDFIVDSVKIASVFEDIQIRLEILFDSSEKGEKALDWIKEFARKTPLNIEEVAEAFALLTAFEIDATEKLQMLGDVAAGVDKPLKQVIEAFNKLSVGRTGEAIESLELLGIAVRKIPELEFDARGALITPIEEAIPIIEALMVEKFGGAMERLGEATAGGWVIILDFITQIKAAVGEFLLPAINEVQDSIISLLTTILDEGEKSREFFENVLGPVIEYAVVKPIVGALATIENMARLVMGWGESMSGILEELIGLYRDLTGWQQALGEGKDVYDDLSIGLNNLGRAVASVLEPMRIFAKLLHAMLTTPPQEWGAVLKETLADFEKLSDYIRTGVKVGQKAPWGIDFGFGGLPSVPGAGEAGKEIEQAAELGLTEFELRRRRYEEERREERMNRALEDAKKLADVAKEYAKEVAEAYRKSFKGILEVDLIKGSGEAIREGVKAGLSAAIFEGESFWSAFADVGKNYLQRMFNTVFDWVVNFFGGLLSGLFGGQGAGQGGFGILGFLGGLFGFQHGAVVEGSKTGVPALVGENFTPEIVGPLNLEGFGFYMSEALRRIPEAFEAARAMFTPAQYEMNPVVILEGAHFGPYEIYRATEEGRVLAGRIDGPL